jgi:hypothetical protein
MIDFEIEMAAIVDIVKDDGDNREIQCETR